MEPFGTDQQTLYPLVDIAHDDPPTLYPNVDYACLRKYGEKNTHFSMALVLENRDGEADRAVGYTCIYRYGSHRVQLECDIATRCWKIIPEELSSILLDDLHPLTLADQILTIIRRLDQQFFDLERHQLQNQVATPRLGRDEQIELKSLTIPEDEEHHKLSKDAVDYGLPSLMASNRSKFSALAPPPVAPRRSRQNSACSTQSSVRYAVFIPPTPSAPIRRRRVVQSIVLHVERKKKSFEKIVDAIRGKERVTMNDLGLEFLRVYDGRFNYREGHTFVMPFRKKTWFLTIDKIIYVECMAGEMGPRSVLVLNYKSQYTSVHV